MSTLLCDSGHMRADRLVATLLLLWKTKLAAPLIVLGAAALGLVLYPA